MSRDAGEIRAGDADIDHVPGARRAAALPLQSDRKDQPELIFALQGSNIEVKTRCQFRQVQTVLSMVAAGLGVAILPQSSLPAGLPDAVRMLAICEPEVTRRIGVIQFSGRPLSQSAGRLIDVFKEQFAAPALDRSAELVEISSFPPLVAVGQTSRRTRALSS